MRRIWQLRHRWRLFWSPSYRLHWRMAQALRDDFPKAFAEGMASGLRDDVTVADLRRRVMQ